MRSGAPLVARVVALALALGVNSPFLLLLPSQKRVATKPVTAAMAMMWIIAPEAPARPSPRQTGPHRDAPHGMAPTEATAPVPAPAAIPAEVRSGPGQEPTAPVPAAHIDWYAVAGKSVQDLLRSSENQVPESSSRVVPEIRVRPESSWIPRMAGTTERMEGGVLRVWTSDLCYREYNPLEPDPFTGRFRKGGRNVCKSRNMAERQSEARAEAIADAVKRKRSGQVPTPEADSSSYEGWVP